VSTAGIGAAALLAVRIVGHPFRGGEAWRHLVCSWLRCRGPADLSLVIVIDVAGSGKHDHRLQVPQLAAVGLLAAPQADRPAVALHGPHLFGVVGEELAAGVAGDEREDGAHHRTYAVAVLPIGFEPVPEAGCGPRRRVSRALCQRTGRGGCGGAGRPHCPLVRRDSRSRPPECSKVTSAGLLTRQAHGEAGRLAQFGPHQRLPGPAAGRPWPMPPMCAHRRGRSCSAAAGVCRCTWPSSGLTTATVPRPTIPLDTRLGR
jgi:hypothetical protein